MNKRMKNISWLLCMIMMLSMLSNSYIVLRAEESYDNISVLMEDAVDITGKKLYTGNYGDTLYEYESYNGIFEADKGELTKITLSALTGVEINFETGYSAEVYEEINGKLVYYDSIRGSGEVINRASKQKDYYIWSCVDYNEEQYSITITYLEYIDELIDKSINVEIGKVYSNTYKDDKYFYYYGEGDDESLYVSSAELYKLILKPGTEVKINADEESYLSIMTEDDGLKAFDRYYYYQGLAGLANYGTEDIEYYILLEGEEGSTYRLSVEETDVPVLKEIETKALSLEKGDNYFYSGFGIEHAFDVDEMEAFLMEKYIDTNGNNQIDYYYYRKGFLCKYEVPARSKVTVKIIPSDVVDIQGVCSVPVYESIDEQPYTYLMYWKEIVGSESFGGGGMAGTSYITEEKYENLEYTNDGSQVKTFYFWVPDYMAGYMCGINVETQENIKVPADKIADVDVRYHTHIQTLGDSQGTKKNGEMAGTSGMAKRLENIWIKVEGNDNLGIQYTTHCQTYGWMPWSCDGEANGTSKESKRLEAIKIQLTGADKDNYDVYYRVHAQSYGWLGWAKNGEPSGTAGYGKRLEGIQVVVVKKGEAAPGLKYAGVDGSSSKYGKQAYVAKTNGAITIPGNTDAPNVMYKTHVQTYGWQKWMVNGQMSGTSGKSKRLEGINIKLTNAPYDGDIVYTTHVQKYGWKDGKPTDAKSTWKKNGEMSGTNGEAKRLEAICIDLTGEMAEHYDVYYRVHAQTFGWLGWAKNGQESGTAGYAKRLEGIQIVLVPKGGDAPADNYGGIKSGDSRPFIEKK